jgi:alpha-maltose-1-phosphate synthase
VTQDTPADAAPPTTGDGLRVDLLTREYPSESYGGAGVHVENLARELRPHVDVRVHCFGGPRDEAGVTAYTDPAGLEGANPAPRTFGVDVEMAAGCARTDVVHSHTWYANLAGHGRAKSAVARRCPPGRSGRRWRLPTP